MTNKKEYEKANAKTNKIKHTQETNQGWIL
jgi:hypothetical protein